MQVLAGEYTLRPSFILGNQICAGGDRSIDPCNGNLGGPLINEVSAEDYSTLYGIVSYGSDCCENCGKSLGVYTKVENYVNWIKTNMRDWNKRKYLWVHTKFLTVKVSNFREINTSNTRID